MHSTVIFVSFHVVVVVQISHGVAISQIIIIIVILAMNTHYNSLSLARSHIHAGCDTLLRWNFAFYCILNVTIAHKIHLQQRTKNEHTNQPAELHSDHNQQKRARKISISSWLHASMLIVCVKLICALSAASERAEVLHYEIMHVYNPKMQTDGLASLSKGKWNLVKKSHPFIKYSALLAVYHSWWTSLK